MRIYWHHCHVLDLMKVTSLYLAKQLLICNASSQKVKQRLSRWGDHVRHATRARVIDEVATILEEVVDGIGGGGEGEFAAVGEGNEVDQEDEERVNGVLVSKT